MPIVHLDYQRDDRPRPWPGWLLLGLSLLALAALAGHYQDLGRRQAAWQARVEQLERLSGRPRQPPPASAGDARSRPAEVRQANKVLRELALPWEAMFRAVEAAGDKRVALLALEPDPAKGVVRISGEAKDFAAMLAYVKRLGARAEFRQVALQSHHVNAEDSERPVRFFALAAWKVAAP